MIRNPLVIGRLGRIVLLVEQADWQQGERDGAAVVFEPGRGYSEVKPMQVWLKFIPFVAVEPPEVWQEPGSKQ
jgi:hypothetical protein